MTRRKRRVYYGLRPGTTINGRQWRSDTMKGHRTTDVGFVGLRDIGWRFGKAITITSTSKITIEFKREEG